MIQTCAFILKAVVRGDGVVPLSSNTSCSRGNLCMCTNLFPSCCLPPHFCLAVAAEDIGAAAAGGGWGLQQGRRPGQAEQVGCQATCGQEVSDAADWLVEVAKEYGRTPKYSNKYKVSFSDFKRKLI